MDSRGTWYRSHKLWTILLLVPLLGVQLFYGLRTGGTGSAATAAATIVNYCFVIEIGLLVGATEMISRYPDDPFAPLVSIPGLFYILLNGGASALVYYLMGPLNVGLAEPLRTMAAGIGAMAIFRSGLFIVRIGGNDIAVGPNLILQVLMQALDRAYDRKRAVPRSKAVTEIMGGISFEQVKEALPTLCFDLMQNVTDQEVADLNNQIRDLTASQTMPDEARILSLGLALFNIVGEETLAAAVRTLGNNIQGFTRINQDMLINLASIDPAKAADLLPEICAELPAHKSSPVAPGQFAVRSAALAPESRAVLVLYKLVDHYGEQRVAVALGILAGQAPATDLGQATDPGQPITEDGGTPPPADGSAPPPDGIPLTDAAPPPDEAASTGDDPPADDGPAGGDTGKPDQT